MEVYKEDRGEGNKMSYMREVELVEFYEEDRMRLVGYEENMGGWELVEFYKDNPRGSETSRVI